MFLLVYFHFDVDVTFLLFLRYLVHCGKHGEVLVRLPLFVGFGRCILSKAEVPTFCYRIECTFSFTNGRPY